MYTTIICNLHHVQLHHFLFLQFIKTPLRDNFWPWDYRESNDNNDNNYRFSFITRTTMVVRILYTYAISFGQSNSLTLRVQRNRFNVDFGNYTLWYLKVCPHKTQLFYIRGAIALIFCSSIPSYLIPYKFNGQ